MKEEDIRMKRLTLVLAAVAVAFYLGGIPALAQHGHSGGTGHGPSATGPSSHPGSGSAPGKTTAASAKSVSERLADNTKLSSKIASLTGMSAQTACSGFKDLGQCVAAAHVSKNLGIPGGFAALKAKMLGTSGGASATSKPLSLGQAIQALDPSVNAKAEAKKGQRQANDDLKESSS
jgi:hypothetical protein